MKKKLSILNFEVLSKDQLKYVKGGGSECGGCGQGECSGGCTTTGDTCGWVQNSCQCTYVAGGTY